MNYSLYRNFAVITLAFGLVGTLAGCLGMSVSFDATQPELTENVSTENSNLQSTNSTEIVPDPEISSAKKTEPITNTENTSAVVVVQPNTNKKNHPPGVLRMSNQTNQPVRLALLARQPAAKNSTSGKKSHIPAHWDFSPQEGSEKGLILSLPEGSLKLEKGDVLVAFAQDGSRRYWGPYIVGETSLPKWDTGSKEWQLVLSD
ncbi:MAG TPA: hypothetical protein VK184_22260 [Nostocaceae cyanobacterium]|nr:hypothetical protein [Nostocaceae cyanobacterium]